MATSPERLRQVGAMIIRRRLDRGMKTKIKLSEVTSLSTRVLGDIEAGKRRAGPVTYIQIETALGWPAGTIDAYLDGFSSLLDDEVIDPFVDEVMKLNGPTQPDFAHAPHQVELEAERDVDPFDIEDDSEAMQEFLRQRAHRKGKSAGRQLRRAQDEAEIGSQDTGGMEPS